MGLDVEKLTGRVALYLETYAALAMQGAIPDTPQGKREKGQSRTPATEAFERFVFANRIPASYIDWRVEHLRSSGNAYNRVRFATVLGILDGDPGCISRWESSTVEWERRYYTAWRKLCRLIAQNIVAEHPDLEINVVLNPEPPETEEEDATPLRNPGADHHRNRRYTVEHTRRKRYERLCEIEANQDCTRTAAVTMLSEELGVGAATIWRAVESVEKQAS
jgi:hypothetical protein